MPKALELKPGTKFRLKMPGIRDVVYIRPEVVSDGPVLWVDNGKLYCSCMGNFQTYFSDNPEVIVTDEKITI
jgi:hypothetical protein